MYAHDERLVGSVEQHALVLVVGGLDGLLEHRASDEMRRFDKLVRRHAPRELLVVVIVCRLRIDVQVEVAIVQRLIPEVLVTVVAAGDVCLLSCCCCCCLKKESAFLSTNLNGIMGVSVVVSLYIDKCASGLCTFDSTCAGTRLRGAC